MTSTTIRGWAAPGRAALLLPLALSLALAGCAVGPDYHRPQVDTPAAYKEARAAQTALPAGEAGSWQQAKPAEDTLRGAWWKLFNDPTLDALETQAQDANQNLKAAAARLGQARALVRNAKSDRYPQLDAGFGPMRERASPASQGRPDNGPATSTTLWRAQASVSYEADLFGRVSSSVNAATADAQQSAALYRSVLLALQASPGITFITELYPRPIRATSLSVVYSVGVAIFGGSAQLIVTWLIQRTGSDLAPAWYMIGATVLSSLPFLWLKETAGKPI